MLLQAAVCVGLQAEEGFVAKVLQLHHLLLSRHCVFIIGPAGAGKSTVWKTLIEVT